MQRTVLHIEAKGWSNPFVDFATCGAGYMES